MPTTTEWTRFQADTGNTGHRQDVTAVPNTPAVYWQFFVQSSPPVVADGTLYTTEYSRKNALVARNAATGRVQWTTQVENGGALGMPVVDDETIVLQSYSLLFAFDRQTGTQLWKQDIGRGPPGSPVVVDGTAYLANGSFAEWATEAFAFDVATGEKQWQTELGTGELHLRGSIAVADDLLFVVDGDLVALNTADGSEAWRVSFAVPTETTPSVADGTVYVTDTAGHLHAVATADGTEHWSAKVGKPDRGTAAAVTGDDVYVGTETGLHALTAAGTNQWQFDMNQATTPTVGTDAVYVGEGGYDHRTVFAIGRDDGAKRWQHGTAEQTISDTVQAGVRGPPTLVEGGVYVVAANGMYAFGR
nr:PQQ-binding-like beta-propeller repeat protein [Halomicroarcula amylolytica]